MNIYRCGIPGCNEYISENELKKVKYENNIINICMLCDDDSYEPMGGDSIDSIKKIEKIRKTRNNND